MLPCGVATSLGCLTGRAWWRCSWELRLLHCSQAVMTEKKREAKPNLGMGKSGMPAGLTM